jgi:hypothetical protein
MSSAYGALQRSKDISPLPLPLEDTLKDGSLVRVVSVDESQHEILHALLNHELRAGDSYPQEGELSLDQFRAYFLNGDAFSVVDLDGEVLGAFYIKPNFPGRCSHVNSMNEFMVRFVMVDS